MSKIIHSMIRVRDLDHSLKFYAECFGLHPAHRLDFPSFSLVYLRNPENDAEIELTWNQGRTEPYTHGDGALIARYFFIQDPDGYKVEVLERHGHYQ